MKSLAEYHPQTFDMCEDADYRMFVEAVAAEPGAQWICKPTGLNCGQGIFVVPHPPTFVKEMEVEAKQFASGMRRRPSKIVQRYALNLPLPLPLPPPLPLIQLYPCPCPCPYPYL
jgi:hypothetical protein